MRLDRIYTKIGDKGTTMLASGEKVEKDSPRIEAYGTVDELNATIALLIDSLNIEAIKHSSLAEIQNNLRKIQNELFDIGGELATPNEFLDPSKQQVVTEQSIARLESEIDKMNLNIPPLENFVLPGGHHSNSFAHLARCVCRRAERRCITLKRSEEVRPQLLVYLNRLSDWLFVASRSISLSLKVKEVTWLQNKSK